MEGPYKEEGQVAVRWQASWWLMILLNLPKSYNKPRYNKDSVTTTKMKIKIMANLKLHHTIISKYTLEKKNSESNLLIIHRTDILSYNNKKWHYLLHLIITS